MHVQGFPYLIVVKISMPL